jgi:hypothetical protein
MIVLRNIVPPKSCVSDNATGLLQVLCWSGLECGWCAICLSFGKRCWQTHGHVAQLADSSTASVEKESHVESKPSVVREREMLVRQRQPPTLPSSHLSFRSARRYAIFRPSRSLLTKSITSRSLATSLELPNTSPSRKLSSSPRHNASCSPTAALSRWYSAGGLNSRKASSCSACFALH